MDFVDLKDDCGEKKKMGNMKHRPRLLPATPETKGVHRRRLSHSLAVWRVGLHLHAAVGTFDSLHCVHDLSPEKAPKSPNLRIQCC